MASPAACAQYSSLLAAGRFSTAPRRRPACSFSRVHIPPAARTAPRSLSVSLSVLRPRAQLGASGRVRSAGDDAAFGFTPCDPAVEDPYYVAAATDLGAGVDADDGFLLQVPFIEDSFERAATKGKGLGEGAHVEGDADLALRVPFVEDPFERAATTGLGDAGLVIHVPTVEVPIEVAATTVLGDAAHGEGDAGLVLHVPTVEEPIEVAATTVLVDDAHGKGGAGLVPHVPTVQEPIEVAATTVLGDDSILYPTRMTLKDLNEYEATDFSRAAINERFQLESKEAKAAVTGAVGGVLSPLRELVDDVRSLESVFDLQEFQIGMPFAAIMTCMGMYQLWKLSPSTCIDVAMYYAFYKLSAIAADVRRRGFSPDWIIRIKLGIIIAVHAKEFGNKGVVPLDYIRAAIFIIYVYSVSWELTGWKKYASKSFLPILFHVLSGGNYFREETGESHVKTMV